MATKQNNGGAAVASTKKPKQNPVPEQNIEDKQNKKRSLAEANAQAAPEKSKNRAEKPREEPPKEEASIEGEVKQALVNENDWRAIPLDEVAVIEKKGERNPSVILRTRDRRTGELVDLDKEQGKKIFSFTTAVMRAINNGSYLAGEGNLGVGKKYKAERTKCAYKLGITGGNLADEPDEPKMLEEQLDCLKFIWKSGRVIMEKVFKMRPKDWLAPIDNAWTMARQFMVIEYQCKKVSALQEREKKEPDVAAAVEARALEFFIENANLPIADEPDSATDVAAWVEKGVWRIEDFDAASYSRTQTGLSYKTTPSCIENWGEILDDMESPALHRQYTYLTYINHHNGATLKRPTRVIKRKGPGGKGELHDVVIVDPFFNPVFKTRKGVEQEAIVVVTLIWSLSRGEEEETGKYGARLKLCPTLTIVGRKPRKIQAPKAGEEYARYGGEISDGDDDEDEPQPRGKKFESADTGDAKRARIGEEENEVEKAKAALAAAAAAALETANNAEKSKMRVDNEDDDEDADDDKPSSFQHVPATQPYGDDEDEESGAL